MHSSNKMVQDIYFTEFYERKNNIKEVIGIHELSTIVNSFKDYRLDFPSIRSKHKYKVITEYLSLEQYVVNQMPDLLNILYLCKGKLSICGTIAAPKFTVINPYYNLYLYFDSCTTVEAKNMLTEYFLSNRRMYCYKTYCIGYFLTHVVIIYLGIFENKNHLLRSIGSAPERHGWNPIDGYFTTISGAVCSVTGIYLLDSWSSITDINTYSEELDIILPGLFIVKDNKIRISDNTISVNGIVYINYGIRGSQHHPHKIFIGGMQYHEIDISIREALRNNVSTEGYCDIYPTINIFYSKEIQLPLVRNWFPKNYKLYKIGISDDRYVAFYNCSYYFNTPREIFKLIVEYWFVAEAVDARRRLLQY